MYEKIQKVTSEELGHNQVTWEGNWERWRQGSHIILCQSKHFSKDMSVCEVIILSLKIEREAKYMAIKAQKLRM